MYPALPDINPYDAPASTAHLPFAPAPEYFTIEVQLIDAIIDGDLPTVERLLSQGADPNATTNDGTPALCVAVVNNHRLIAERLLARRCKVDVRDGAGCTSLELAVRMNDPLLVRTLLRYGASPNAAFGNGARPLYEAVFSYDPAAPVEIRASILSIVEELLEYGAAPNDLNYSAPGDLQYRMYATLWAASKGYIEILEMILSHGGDPCVRDPTKGDTALHHAIRAGQTTIVGVLLSQEGCAHIMDERNADGLSPLELAQALGDTIPPGILVRLRQKRAQMEHQAQAALERDIQEAARREAEHEERLNARLADERNALATQLQTNVVTAAAASRSPVAPRAHQRGLAVGPLARGQLDIGLVAPIAAGITLPLIFVLFGKMHNQMHRKNK